MAAVRLIRLRVLCEAFATFGISVIFCPLRALVILAALRQRFGKHYLDDRLSCQGLK